MSVSSWGRTNAYIVMINVIKSTSARYWSPEDDVVAPRAQKASLVGTH